MGLGSESMPFEERSLVYLRRIPGGRYPLEGSAVPNEWFGQTRALEWFGIEGVRLLLKHVVGVHGFLVVFAVQSHCCEACARVACCGLVCQ